MCIIFIFISIIIIIYYNYYLFFFSILLNKKLIDYEKYITNEYKDNRLLLISN